MCLPLTVTSEGAVSAGPTDVRRAMVRVKVRKGSAVIEEEEVPLSDSHLTGMPGAWS